MRIGVISDIHSNIFAFKAVIEKLEEAGCDEYFLLGDYISDTLYTRETLKCLYDFINTHTCHVLRGNREEYMLAQREAQLNNRVEDIWIDNSASGNLLYTYRELLDEDFEFFKALPKTFVYAKEGFPAITCAHGSPGNTRELLELDGDNTRQWLEKIDTSYMICAHTHFPGQLEHKGKYYFNSGCVGIAINAAGFAQYMYIDSIVTDGNCRWEPSFGTVSYDNRRVIDDLRRSDLINKAPWFVNNNIYTLLTGDDVSVELVVLVDKLAKKANPKARWPYYDDCFYEEAAGKIGLVDYRRPENIPWEQRL